MTNDRFNYASTSEEFSTNAEDDLGESVKEVAQAQENDDFDLAFDERDSDWETESKRG